MADPSEDDPRSPINRREAQQSRRKWREENAREPEERRPKPRSIFWPVLGAILAAVAIIAALAIALGVIATGRELAREKANRALAGCQRIDAAIYRFAAHERNHEVELPRSLQELISPPFGAPSFLSNGPADLIDPWGNPYQFERRGDTWIVFTRDPDGMPVSQFGIGDASKVAP
jgi:hypothetical protein